MIITLVTCAFIRFITICLFPLFLSAYVVADIDDDEAEQDFLFLIEPAYSQEKGEWQLALVAAHSRYRVEDDFPRSEDRAFDLAIEYGFTDRLQIEVALPYQRTTLYESQSADTSSAVGNPEVGLSYRLMAQQDNRPAISLGISATVGSSDKEPVRSEHWGYEAFVSASQSIADVGFLHASIRYEQASNGSEKELTYGLAYVLPVSEGWFCLLELQKEHEREKDKDETEREKLALFSLGVSYHFAQGPTIGIAYGKGSEAENLDNIAQLKIQYEY